jgi:Uncharacterized membrane protein (homolog of Drosophila rhomboid)
MFFPIGDVNVKQGTKPVLSYILIGINVMIFLYQVTLSPAELNELFATYATIPADIMAGHNFISLLTCTFLHGGWMHLIGNMLFLWVFADNIEASVGYVRFLLFYLLSGIIASLTHVLLTPNSSIPCVGASGAIAACLGAYIVLYPVKIRFYSTF